MTDVYKIIGAELSPFSVKVRSYLRFKQIPHQWISQSMAISQEYKDYFRIPVVPLVVTPDDEGLQDSTPVMEALEVQFPDHSVYPEDPTLRFLSDLLEEFGDEWGNKWMFHMRWAREADIQNATTRLARLMTPDADEDQRAGLAQNIRDRMVDRVFFVGSNAQNAPEIEAGFKLALEQLNTHLANRPYLFGARPGFGDFGVWAQIYSAHLDTTAGALISAKYLNVLAWIQRMTWPRVEGDFETWEALAPTLEPFMSDQVGARFLPWSVANMAAMKAGAEEFSVSLAGHDWVQKPQKYHAKSLAVLRDKYAKVADKSALDPILEKTSCLDRLQS